jgi:hypothetical protein
MQEHRMLCGSGRDGLRAAVERIDRLAARFAGRAHPWVGPGVAAGCVSVSGTLGRSRLDWRAL